MHRVYLYNTNVLYIAFIISILDCGCIVYNTAAKSTLAGLDRLQAKAPRLCCWAFKTAPVASLQVEVGEIPLKIYSSNKGYHIGIFIISKWARHNISYKKGNRRMQGIWPWWYSRSGEKESNEMGIETVACSKTINVTAIPPWLFRSPVVNMET